MGPAFRIQWYPGHMAKARRELERQIKLVDFVVEVADARAPVSTRNPEIAGLVRGRPRLLLLAKADLAEPGSLSRWVHALEARGVETLAVTLTGETRSTAILSRLRSWIDRNRSSMRRGALPLRGIDGVRLPKGAGTRPIRGLVVGIPNTGKSTLIRSLGGRGVRVGARAGMTRGLQWVNIGGDVQLLDSPGLLWPRLETGMTALKLAWLGCVGQGGFDRVEAALGLIEWFAARDPEPLAQRYRLEPATLESPHEALGEIARGRGHLGHGGEPDLLTAAETLLVDLREGRLGPLGLDELAGD